MPIIAPNEPWREVPEAVPSITAEGAGIGMHGDINRDHQAKAFAYRVVEVRLGNRNVRFP